MIHKREKDTLFNDMSDIQSFQFDEKVATVFDDMVLRSIPGYLSQQFFMADVVSSYIAKHKKACVVDFGCSTGESISYLAHYASQKDIDISNTSIYAVDYSDAMIQKCRAKLQNIEKKWNKIVYEQLNIIEISEFFEKVIPHHILCDVIFLHFVLQFVGLEYRAHIIQECWKHLKTGGFILIGEKLRHRDRAIQNQWETMQYNFKRSMGYTHTQIESKKRALEGVLLSQYQDDFIKMITGLSKSRCEMYYMHGEFQCYIIHKEGNLE